MPEITASDVKTDVCIIYDYENRWGIDTAEGVRNTDKGYIKAVNEHYRALRKCGVMADIADMEGDISGYKVVAAPMLYMYRARFQDKVRDFVKNGGTFIGTYWSGIVDEYDLCYLGGTPGELTDVFGLRSAEIDVLAEGEANIIVPTNQGYMFAEGEYSCHRYCDVVKLTTAKGLMVYKGDYYAESPALTVNKYGNGLAYYAATAPDARFMEDFYKHILNEAGIARMADGLPDGVLVSTRETDEYIYAFYQNYNAEAAEICAPADAEFLCGGTKMDGYGVTVAKIRK
jgi:beta-galactosidase